jgi:hypothetical protein
MLFFPCGLRRALPLTKSVPVTRVLGVVALSITALAVGAQAPRNTSPTPPPNTGQVIYSRSIDENGKVTTTPGQAATTAAQAVNAPVATDAEREAVRFISFDMDVHIASAQQHFAARAQLTVRNDGSAAIKHIPLQISSSLNWERIRVSGKDVAFQVATLNSDVDHTGQLHEAAVLLAAPLAPGASVQLDVTYSGTIAPSAQRLIAIGTPEAAAMHSDWDEIGVPFTGLRGFGNVVWYPAASVPVILGDGARLFDEMGEHKLKLSGAAFRLRLTVEFPAGNAPNIALINGHPAAMAVTDGSLEVAGVATASIENTSLETGRLGFEAPSLFVAVRIPVQATNTTLWTLPDNVGTTGGWAQAATTVTPFLQGWLGQRPRSQLTILDLPDPDGAPFETGALLATGIRAATAEQLDTVMVHALARAWMQSPRAWLSEGVANFMNTVWLEKQGGRAKALETLEASRSALALAEPTSPGESAGQPLTQAISPIFYRIKATYVFWMLRDLVGDAALSAALRAYDPAADASSEKSEPEKRQFEKLVEQASERHDLGWFFADWVDADKGLPDLTVDSVIPLAAQQGNTLLGVNLSNTGYAGADVPVTVRTNETTATQRVHVPGRGKIVQRILILGQPSEVEVNDGTVPETEASVHETKVTLSAAPAQGR